jgi:hypothetical protein
MRRIDMMNDAFPLPEAPQIAIFSPGANMIERFLKTGGLLRLVDRTVSRATLGPEGN